MGKGGAPREFQGGGYPVKSMLAVNFRPDGKIPEPALRQLVDAQIENSIALGWAANDILIVSNLDLDVPATVVT